MHRTAEFLDYLRDWEGSSEGENETQLPLIGPKPINVAAWSILDLLVKALSELDDLTPGALRVPQAKLLPWKNGLCTAAGKTIKDRTIRLKDPGRWPVPASGLTRVKALINQARVCTEDLNELAAKSHNLQRHSWGFASLLRSSVDVHQHANQHEEAIAEILNEFIRDLSGEVQRAELRLLGAEVIETEVFKHDAESTLTGHRRAGLDSFLHKWEIESREIEEPWLRSLSHSEDAEMELLVSKSVEAIASRKHRRDVDLENLPPPTQAESNASQKSYYEQVELPEEMSLNPEFAKQLARPEDRMLLLRQQSVEVEDEQVSRVQEAMARISELMTIFAEKISSQTEVSGSILATAETAVYRVEAATEELKKTLDRRYGFRRIVFFVYLSLGTVIFLLDLLKTGRLF